MPVLYILAIFVGSGVVSCVVEQARRLTASEKRLIRAGTGVLAVVASALIMTNLPR